MNTPTTEGASRRRSRLLGLLVLGAAALAPFAANADAHHPPPHHVTRHKVCKPHRVYDHHHHYHTVQQCHWVNR